MNNTQYTDELFQYDLKNHRRAMNQKTKESELLIKRERLRKEAFKFKELVHDIRWMPEDKFHKKYDNEKFEEISKSSQLMSSVMIMMVSLFDTPKEYENY